MTLSDEQIAKIAIDCGHAVEVTDAGYPCDALWFGGNLTAFARAVLAAAQAPQQAEPVATYIEALEKIASFDWEGDEARKIARAALASPPPQESAAPFAKGSWQHAVDDQLVGYGRTSQEFATPHDAVQWLLQNTSDAALASPPPQESAPGKPEQLTRLTDVADAVCKQFSAAGIGAVIGSPNPAEDLHARAILALGGTVEREHIASAACWCSPEVDFVAESGAKVIVHRRVQ